MTNYMKLLRAFIEASGFDIEDTQKVFIKGVEQKGCSSLIPIDADNIDYLEVINDYKVTKKPNPLDEKDIGSLLDVYLCKGIGKVKESSKYQMAYESLRNQVRLLSDNNCLGLSAVDLRKQIDLCEGFIK